VATVRADRLVVSSTDHSVVYDLCSVDTMNWSGEHRGSVIEACSKKNDSVTATQRAFRTRFGLCATDAAPDQKTILRRVSNVRARGSALPRKPSGRPRNVRTPENVQRVRALIEESPRRSARKHAAALGISDRTETNLHADLRMHPYKMMVAQELSVTDWETRRTLYEDILQHVPPTAVLWCNDEAHFHLSGTVNKQIFGIGQRITLVTFTKDLCTALESLSGALCHV